MCLCRQRDLQEKYYFHLNMAWKISIPCFSSSLIFSHWMDKVILTGWATTQRATQVRGKAEDVLQPPSLVCFSSVLPTSAEELCIQSRWVVGGLGVWAKAEKEQVIDSPSVKLATFKGFEGKEALEPVKVDKQRKAEPVIYHYQTQG